MKFRPLEAEPFFPLPAHALGLGFVLALQARIVFLADGAQLLVIGDDGIADGAAVQFARFHIHLLRAFCWFSVLMLVSL